MGKSFLLNVGPAAWLGAVVGLGASAWPAQAQYDPDWVNHVWLAPQVGINISARFSLNGQFPISSSQPGPAGVSGVDHFYNDGYVRVDQTGNAQGFTSFWGYSSANQYQAASQTLLMHSATAYSATADSTRDDAPYLGLELGYGVAPWRWDSVRLGFDLGFGFLPIRIDDNQTFPAAVNQAPYAFNTGGIVLPTAPYNGGPSGVGPTIHDVATALANTTVLGTVIGTRSLDTTLYSFRLGPSVQWDLSQYVGLSASAGGALGIVSGDLKFNETILLPDGGSAVNAGRIGSTEVVYGAYAKVAALFHVMSHGDIYLSAEYVTMGNSSIDSAGRHVELDLGGQVYFSAGMNWPF